VKLIKTAPEQHEFQLSSREKDLLLNVLLLYPRIPSGYQPISRSDGQQQEANQRLLEESLAETRLHNQKELQALLSDPQRLKQKEREWQLTLSSGDMEWLLQVLNDIRVGSWIRLGSPEMPLKTLNAETAPNIWAMEMAGSFQMRFLELLEE
jgi:hypothetical protein